MTRSEQSALVLQRLLEALVDDPDALCLDAIESAGTVAFRVTEAAPDDRGKIIGREGSHARAIRFVAARMGSLAGETWDFSATFPLLARRGPGERPGRPDRTERHDPSQMSLLMADVLRAILQDGVSVLAQPDGDDFVFRVSTSSRRDASALFDTEAGCSLTTELGTLFRSIGRRHGVNYRIEIAP